MSTTTPIPRYSEAYLAESRASQLLLVGWITTGAAMLVVSLKLFTTGILKKTMGIDDFFIFFAMVLSIMATISVQMSVQLGLGRHVAWVMKQGLQQLADCLLWQTVGFPFNILAFSLPNISIAILVERLLHPNPVRKVCMYTMVLVQVTLACLAVILYFAQCQPTRYIWDAARIDGQCWDASVFFDYYYFFSAYTAATDLVLAVVPVTAFWQLNMKTSTRLGICVLMALTLLSAIVTVAKTCYLPLLADHADLLYLVVPLVNWGLIEQNVVIIAACVPTLRPFFHSFGRWRRGDTTGGEASKATTEGSGATSGNMSQGGTASRSDIRTKQAALRSSHVRLNSSSELELHDVLRDGDEVPSEEVKGDGDGSAEGRTIVRTLQVNVDVSNDWKPEDGKKVKAHW